MSASMQASWYALETAGLASHELGDHGHWCPTTTICIGQGAANSGRQEPTLVAGGGGGIARCWGPMLRHVNSLKGSGLSTSSSCWCWMQLVSRRLAAFTTGSPPGLCASSMQLLLPASSLRLHQNSLPSSCCSCTSCCRLNLQSHKAATEGCSHAALCTHWA